MPITTTGAGIVAVPPNPLLSGLEAYWGFDSNTLDSSGNSRTLTFSGPYTNSTNFKKLGTAALQPVNGFPATRTWGGSFDLLTNDVSIQSWIGRNNGANTNIVSLGWSNIFTIGIRIDAIPSGQLVATIGGVAVYTSVVGSDEMPNRTPRHVVLTWDHTTGTWVLYLSGVQVGTGSGVTPATHDLTGTFSTPTGFAICGTDDTAIYSRVLSQADVTASYNGGTGVNPTL